MSSEVGVQHAAESILIPHTAFACGVNLVQQAMKLSDGISQPTCVAILGPSGAGKTRMLDRCAEGYRPYRDANGICVPVLQFDVPSKPTVKALASEFLRALGATDFDRGTEIQQTYRAKVLMKECKVRAIFLDDFHHFVDQSSNNVLHYAADWLKHLVDEVKPALIITGLPYAVEVINLNEQLARRFMAPVRLTRFLWQHESDREEFRDIMDAFQAGLQQYFSMPQLRSEEMSFRFYCASGGLIGYVAKILDWATKTAALQSRTELTLKNLDHAYMEAVWRKERSMLPQSPFSWSALPKVTNQLLTSVQAFGEPGIPESRRRAGKLRQTELSSVLTR